MPEYDVGFAEKLAEVAKLLCDKGMLEVNSIRTVIYISHLSIEIALKAMLEKAGKPIKDIKLRNHSLPDLAIDVDRCVVQVLIPPNNYRYMSASRFRSLVISSDNGDVTVGTVIDAVKHGASSYPNKIRYGKKFSSFPPEVMAQAALLVVDFARQYWDSIHQQLPTGHGGAEPNINCNTCQ